ncbi:hypothetical protein [Mesorhizobium sp. M0019]|uniref:hypothetical protein n=1 Tax=Mesorhizobium sp. M0019 TaxID=2956845 RepID=UPI00333A5E8F
MTLLQSEIDANGVQFAKNWADEMSSNMAALAGNSHLVDSYQRLTAIQALKAGIVAKKYSPGSAEFFYEAHNDTLTSHVSASFGAWRLSLQALRSAIENSLAAIYYKDHPIELEQWTNGDFRISFSDLFKYALFHPRIGPHENHLKTLADLKSEYATLSKAVHSSAKMFRMTDSAGLVLLWSTDNARLSMWSTRHRKTVQAISQLMVTLHAEDLKGTAAASLRSVLYFSIGSSKRAAIKKHLSVTIPAP